MVRNISDGWKVTLEVTKVTLDVNLPTPPYTQYGALRRPQLGHPPQTPQKNLKISQTQNLHQPEMLKQNNNEQN